MKNSLENAFFTRANFPSGFFNSEIKHVVRKMRCLKIELNPHCFSGFPELQYRILLGKSNFLSDWSLTCVEFSFEISMEKVKQVNTEKKKFEWADNSKKMRSFCVLSPPGFQRRKRKQCFFKSILLYNRDDFDSEVDGWKWASKNSHTPLSFLTKELTTNTWGSRTINSLMQDSKQKFHPTNDSLEVWNLRLGLSWKNLNLHLLKERRLNVEFFQNDWEFSQITSVPGVLANETKPMLYQKNTLADF